jgi:glutathione synthase/RimK-type ligase-like ATP-grasp enzyme
LDAEWSHLEEMVGLQTGPLVVNPPDASVSARNRLHQLQIATRAGLRVPETIVSTEGSVLRQFAAKGDCITKGIARCYVEDDGITRTGFTKLAESSDFEGENFRGCPVLIQRRISASAVWRIVIVGNQAFSCRFTGPGLMSTPDSRTVLEELVGDPVTPKGDDIEAMLKSVCRGLGIQFCSCDFVEDHFGRLFFIDLNPDGQWAWLQMQYGLRISDSLVRLSQARRHPKAVASASTL